MLQGEFSIRSDIRCYFLSFLPFSKPLTCQSLSSCASRTLACITVRLTACLVVFIKKPAILADGSTRWKAVESLPAPLLKSHPKSTGISHGLKHPSCSPPRLSFQEEGATCEVTQVCTCNVSKIPRGKTGTQRGQRLPGGPLCSSEHKLLLAGFHQLTSRGT